MIQQNIFGGSLGGPVSPGGKLGFFFVNYQGTRQRSGDSPGTLISTFIPYVPASDRGAANAGESGGGFWGAERRSGGGESAGISEQSVWGAGEWIFVPAAEQCSGGNDARRTWCSSR